MNTYMVEMDLPSDPDSAFFELIPDQKDLILNLINDQVLLNYSLSSDWQKAWGTFRAASEKEVIEIIHTFPLIAYMQIDIKPLAFNMVTSIKMPQFSLN